MFIKLPPSHYKNGLEDRLFLQALDKKVHYIHTSSATTNISRTSHVISADEYHTKKILSVSEIEKILSLINEENGLTLTPINTNWGLAVGFAIFYTFDKKPQICFLEQQLPEGYNFSRLAETFNKDENKRMLKKIGLEEPKERGYYDY